MGGIRQSKWEKKASPSSNSIIKNFKVSRHSPSWSSKRHIEPENNNSNSIPAFKHVSPNDSMIPPPNKWRLYIFKDLTELEMLPLEEKDSYLFGRDRRIVDIPTDHESCSKQHAVIQFKAKMTLSTLSTPASLSFPSSIGETGRGLLNKKFDTKERMELNARPYLIDLDSVNGTTLNGITIEPKRYYELRGNDLIRIADSSRDYVMLEIPSQM